MAAYYDEHVEADSVHEQLAIHHETAFDHPAVVFCPDGPMLLRGEHEVTDPSGRVHRTTRPVSAVCRCGKSAIQPWCDGTHKLVDGLRKGQPATSAQT